MACPEPPTTINGDPADLERSERGMDAGPGLVVLMDNGWATCRVRPLAADGLLLGRGLDGCFGEDDWVSRSHVRVTFEGGRLRFHDLGSRNGSFLDGERFQGRVDRLGPAVLRLGRSLCWALPDLSLYADGVRLGAEEASGHAPVLGAALRQVWREIGVAARASDTLLVTGPSGAGKELAARAFHRAVYASDTRAPFVAVNCATIPPSLAERLLFGAKRGAYSGANADAIGFVQAAHDGTLFLDEVAELEPGVQAKLLRVLENREVTPLGATDAQPVSLRVCAATLRDLRAEVAAGRFREDLYYRLGRPAVCMPALSKRLDELPFLVERSVRAIDTGLRPATDLIEACALRPWPGNVRELLGELRHAAIAALDAGKRIVNVEHLALDAGLLLSEPPPAPLPRTRRTPTAWPSDAAIREALARDDGNVSAAARALGLHRNQIRRWLQRNAPADE